MNKIKEKKLEMKVKQQMIKEELDVGFGFKRGEPQPEIQTRRKTVGLNKKRRIPLKRHSRLSHKKKESKAREILIEMGEFQSNALDYGASNKEDKKRLLIQEGLSRLKKKSKMKKQQKTKMRELKGLLQEMADKSRIEKEQYKRKQSESPDYWRPMQKILPGKSQDKGRYSRRSIDAQIRSEMENKTYTQISENRKKLRNEVQETYGQYWTGQHDNNNNEYYNKQKAYYHQMIQKPIEIAQHKEIDDDEELIISRNKSQNKIQRGLNKEYRSINKIMKRRLYTEQEPGYEEEGKLVRSKERSRSRNVQSRDKVRKEGEFFKRVLNQKLE
jgi:hypothetical protein